MLIWSMGDQSRATCLLWSWITLIGSLVDLSASSVIIVGNRYYYDVTYMLWSRKFQVIEELGFFEKKPVYFSSSFMAQVRA